MKRLPAASVALFGAIAAIGAALDLSTKWLAFTRVGEPTSRRVIWPEILSFTTSYNEGALWGIGRYMPGSNILFAALSFVAAGFILYFLFWQGAAQDFTYTVALGLVMAGVIGNCYDRLVWGKVRDWIYFELINWPIFNIADSCLVCGASVLVAQAAYTEWLAKRSPSATEHAPPATVEPTEQSSGTTA